MTTVRYPDEPTATPTRADYLASRVTHREYYAALAATAGIRFGARDPLVVEARAALAAGDEHLNTIPLARWDRLAGAYRRAVATATKAHEGAATFSLGVGVCMLKEAVRQAAEAAG